MGIRDIEKVTKISMEPNRLTMEDITEIIHMLGFTRESAERVKRIEFEVVWKSPEDGNEGKEEK